MTDAYRSLQTYGKYVASGSKVSHAYTLLKTVLGTNVNQILSTHTDIDLMDAYRRLSLDYLNHVVNVYRTPRGSDIPVFAIPICKLLKALEQRLGLPITHYECNEDEIRADYDRLILGRSIPTPDPYADQRWEIIDWRKLMKERHIGNFEL